MKICIKCNKEKEWTDFYTGQGDCKTCVKERVRLREIEKRKDPEWLEKELERQRKKYHRLEYKDKHKPTYEMKKKAMDKYKARFPEKILAKNKMSGLKAKIKGNHLHHWSYNEEHYRDVIELEESDHNLIHRLTTYDQERKMYRTQDGVLLDSKISACRHYLSLGVNTQIIVDILYNK
jgi:arylamine N-acetyltransferase